MNIASIIPLTAKEVWEELMAAQKLPKPAIKKLCLKLQKRTTPNIAQGVLYRVLNASNPGLEILIAKDDEITLAQIMREFDEAGYAGMVIVGDLIFPVILDLTPKTFTTYRMMTHDGNEDGTPWDPAKFETFWIPDQVTQSEGDPDDLAWCVANERQFQIEVARAALITLRVTLLHCTVVLSRKMGFSNIPRDIPVAIDQSDKKRAMKNVAILAKA